MRRRARPGAPQHHSAGAQLRKQRHRPRAEFRPRHLDALDDVVSNSKRWLSEGLPPSDQIQQRFIAVAADSKIHGVLGEQKAKLDAEDAKRPQISTARF